MAALDAVQMQASGEHGEQVMRQFDKDLQTAMLDNTTGSVYLSNGNYNLTDEGNIEITVSNGYGDTQSENIPMGTLRYEDEAGNKFAHQAGGVWRKTGESASVVSKPGIRYYTEQSGGNEVGRIDFSVTNLRGNVERGTNRVTQQPSASTSGLDVGDVGFVSHVAIEVSDTPYHDAWYRFLKTEFEASSASDCDVADGADKNIICHDEANQEVTVIATIDGTNPFANHVEIDPTVYGGLYADRITGAYGSDLTVRGYENHNISNRSADLFAIDDGVTLNGGAEVQGIPVVNDHLRPTASGDPNVSPLAYAAALERGNSPPRYDYINTTADGSTAAFWLTGQHDSLVANMSQPFDSVDSIDSNVENKALDYLESNPDVTDIESYGGTTVDSGLYYGDDLDGSITTINTSDGDVHIGIGSGGGPLELSNLSITGNNSAYIYTESHVDIRQDVEVPGNRTGALWVYGSNSSTIDVERDYEGVVYAPGSHVTIDDGVEITGAVVGGTTNLHGDATINFDRTLRTDVPIPTENRDISIEADRTRNPLDVTFVLDRSGSMGETGTVTGSGWQSVPSPPGDLSLTVDSAASHSLEYYSCSPYCTLETADPGESFDPYFSSVRIKGGDSTDSVTIRYGSDPEGLRADATKDFIDLLNQSNDDRAGVFEFNYNGYELHSLSRDIDDVHDSVSVTSGGGTDISSGIERAIDEYSATPTPGRDRIMIVLSDGENSNPAADSRTRAQAQRAENRDITVYTIGLGENNINKPLLRDAATDDGEFHMIDNASQLEDIFEGIANREIQQKSDLSFDISVSPTMSGTSSDYVVNIDTQTVNIGG
ncbi:VWA domain-containing protein [Natrinema sp. 1APR25-10V2]|uniref:vWA domain-containing protein n=1 Tax=Natrinema sp. 1APR25-10V2 TaxID=2951081 RepID=UPI002874F6ED|nr:VWA domain-containing protein [Natrinema sp. 1APR25-10V2]MDS0475551.1 VWA domain-containing protein [Natrinema sp. 1APR25-10V2]